MLAVSVEELRAVSDERLREREKEREKNRNQRKGVNYDRRTVKSEMLVH